MIPLLHTAISERFRGAARRSAIQIHVYFTLLYFIDIRQLVETPLPQYDVAVRLSVQEVHVTVVTPKLCEVLTLDLSVIIHVQVVS